MAPVWAVVVTFNRKALLEQNLAALDASKPKPDHVLVIDNASTDGTPEMVREKFPWADLRTLPENVGGAGGFHAGMQTAYDGGAEWIWLMDDDTIPQPDSLAKLLAARERVPAGARSPLILASKVVWEDGRIHPMNAPGF